MGIHTTHEERKNEYEEEIKAVAINSLEKKISRYKKYEPLFADELFKQYMKDEVMAEMRKWQSHEDSINLSKDGAIIQIAEIRAKRLEAKQVSFLPEKIKKDAEMAIQEIGQLKQ